MAKDKEPKKRTPKPKQADLPGMADRRIPELDKAAAKYKECRDSRMEATDAEVDAKEKLMNLMKENELTVYRSSEIGLMAEIVVTDETVKVKKYEPKQPKPED